VVYGAGKALGVANQWGDVLEQDAGLREIRHIPNQFFYLVLVYGGLLYVVVVGKVVAGKNCGFIGPGAFCAGSQLVHYWILPVAIWLIKRRALPMAISGK
jgi:hypothetical protein